MLAPAYGSQKRELVLNYIIERKRMDDLAGSIVDGTLSGTESNKAVSFYSVTA